MTTWRDEYMRSLREAKRSIPVNQDLVEACSQLADRVAALEAEKAVLLQQQRAPTDTTTEKPTTPSKAAASKDKTTTNVATTNAGSDPASTAQLRLDLAEALRSRGQLQSKLRTAEDELQKLRSKTRVDTKRIGDLTAERYALLGRLKDRNEELAGKNKLLKDVQDENLTLNIQLDVTEQKAKKIKAENEELVARWMKRMGHEADALNLENESPNGRARRSE